MNYYERHLGDYARDTGHLSILEHGVYTLLLDRYYATEDGIPADQAHRLCRARTQDERDAVDAVLAEFFILADTVWRHIRVDEEIEKAHARMERARDNGRRGGRPKKPRGNPEETQRVISGFSNETQAKAHQSPDTNHQEEEQKHSSSCDDPRVQSLETRLSEVTTDAVETWNESALVAGGLAKVRTSVGMDKRRQQVRRMLSVARDICRERFGDTRIPRKFWVGLWDQYAGDDFYSGRTAGGRGHENWRPDFKFLTHPETVVKLYDKVCAGEATA